MEAWKAYTAQYRATHKEQKREYDRRRAEAKRKDREAKKRLGLEVPPWNNSNSRNKRKEIVWAAKEKGCAACGRKYHPVAMDLHHLNPETKVASVSEMVTRGKSIKALESEIAKCVPLCACCHRMFHANLIELPECHERESNPQGQ
jgi:hypothetical protein